VTAPPPQLAAQSSPLPDGVPIGWALVALVGAGVVVFGLRRLPGEVLAGGGTSCVLGEQTT
jgi:hypothetical protein